MLWIITDGIRYLFFVDTGEIAESSLMGFLAKLESITCKRDRKPVRHYRFAECKLQTCPRTWLRSNFLTMY